MYEDLVATRQPTPYLWPEPVSLDAIVKVRLKSNTSETSHQKPFCTIISLTVSECEFQSTNDCVNVTTGHEMPISSNASGCSSTVMKKTNTAYSATRSLTIYEHESQMLCDGLLNTVFEFHPLQIHPDYNPTISVDLLPCPEIVTFDLEFMTSGNYYVSFSEIILTPEEIKVIQINVPDEKVLPCVKTLVYVYDVETSTGMQQNVEYFQGDAYQSNCKTMQSFGDGSMAQLGAASFEIICAEKSTWSFILRQSDMQTMSSNAKVYMRAVSKNCTDYALENFNNYAR